MKAPNERFFSAYTSLGRPQFLCRHLLSLSLLVTLDSLFPERDRLSCFWKLSFLLWIASKNRWVLFLSIIFSKANMQLWEIFLVAMHNRSGMKSTQFPFFTWARAYHMKSVQSIIFLRLILKNLLFSNELELIFEPLYNWIGWRSLRLLKRIAFTIEIFQSKVIWSPRRPNRPSVFSKKRPIVKCITYPVTSSKLQNAFH